MSPSPPSRISRKRNRNDFVQSAPENNKLFQCSECGKSYARADHLSRHVRLHTKEKPYACQVCGKCFARADLLKRHTAGHDARGDHDKARNIPTTHQDRVRKACEPCADLHLRCDEQKPCTRCRRKHITCNFSSNSSPEVEIEAATRQPQRLTPDRDSQIRFSPDAFNQELSISASQTQCYSSAHVDAAGNSRPAGGVMSHSADPLPMVDSMVIDPSFEDGNTMNEFLQNIVGGCEAIAVPKQNSGTWTPRNIFDFGQTTNLELSDLDLHFLKDYNLQNPFTASPDMPEVPQSVVSSLTTNPPSALGTEALQKSSTWRFQPTRQDNPSNEQHNLSLPTAESTKKLLIDRRMTAEPLQNSMRDRILAIIVSSCRGSSIPRSILCFPSLELLDSLLQFYLSSKFAIFSGLVHLPTLRPSQLRPELLAAMIAAGAALTPDVSLQKLGFALQEALRVTVPQLFEDDNTMIADVQILQCMGICLSIGLWSGNSRKMELSESFLQPYVTMIRRRGWFLRSAYETIVPPLQDDQDRLEDTWQAWITQESRKRLVFFFFLHSTRQSISLFTNPLVSYAELGLPLPDAEDLWLAQTALSWKTNYLRRLNINEKPTYLGDILHDIDLLADQQHALFDAKLVSELTLGVTWGLIWEYRQVCSMTRGQSTQWSSSTILLSSRLAELAKLLECIRISAPEASTLKLFLELLHMHLYAPLEIIHLFAGAQGHEEAHRVYPQLQEWVNTSASRQAIFHAAQVLAAARKIDQGCLRDFWAIAMYQAGLILWSYGFLSNAVFDSGTAGSSQPRSTYKRPHDMVLLDGLSGSAVQGFITLNRGVGAITGSPGGPNKSSPVFLSDPGSAMAVLIDICKANHRAQQSLPPLIRNLICLMEGLQAAVTGFNPSS